MVWATCDELSPLSSPPREPSDIKNMILFGPIAGVYKQAKAISFSAHGLIDLITKTMGEDGGREGETLGTLRAVSM